MKALKDEYCMNVKYIRKIHISIFGNFSKSCEMEKEKGPFFPVLFILLKENVTIVFDIYTLRMKNWEILF